MIDLAVSEVVSGDPLSNFSKLNLIQCSAFASITWIKKNRPKKGRLL